MDSFYWKIVGGDISILEQSGKRSQNSFKTIGKLFLTIVVIIFFSFFGLFLGVFDSYFIAFFGGLILTFLISVIYLLNLISLEPTTLPILKSKGSTFLSYFIRVSTVVMFAVFVSKCLETSILGFLVDDDISKINLKEFIDNYSNRESQMFVQHMILLNKTYPKVWYITSIVVVLFLIPIVLKHRLKKQNEYFAIKERRDTDFVISEHKTFKKELYSLYKRIYNGYSSLKKEDRKDFREHPIKYMDEPFNLKKIEFKDFQSSDDFIYLSNWE